MKNVIIDLGNYNIKYFCNGNKGSFSSKYMNKFNPNGESYERIEIDGKITYIGVGTLSREFNKVKREYLPQVLYAIDKATNDNNINLCLLLPIVQMPNKNEFINSLKEKVFYYKVNDNIKTIKINKVVVLPEGYVSYYSLDNIKADDDILVIDIGSRTINYSWFSNNKIQDSFTEKLGIFDFYSNIKEYENSKGEDYSEEDIERLIKNNRITVETKFYVDFFKEILNRTKGKVNLKTFDVHFVGGGALLLRKFIEVNTPAKIHDDSEYANVLGANRLCSIMWKDEN